MTLEDERLRQLLDAAAADLRPEPGAVERIVQSGRRARRRRTIQLTAAAAMVAVAAVITPVALHANASRAGQAASPRTQTAHSPSVAPRVDPSRPDHRQQQASPPPSRNDPGAGPGTLPTNLTAPPPDPGLVQIQQQQQAAFVASMAGLGATVLAADSGPDISAVAVSGGGNISIDGRKGFVTVRVFKDSHSFNLHDPCAGYAVNNPWLPPDCARTTAPDGSTTWTYRLVAKDDPLRTVNAMNIRTDGQVILVQSTNYLAAGSGTLLKPEQVDCVLTTEQAATLAADPAFVR